MKTPKYIYHGRLGQHVSDAAEIAVQKFARLREKIARHQGRRQLARCRFVVLFNRIEIGVLPGDTSLDITARFMAQNDAREQAYRNSPAAIAAEAAAVARIRQAQSELDGLMAELDPIVEAPLPDLMEWVSRFLNAANLQGTEYDRSRLLGRFAEAGYRENAFVGDRYKAILDENVDAMGRYIIGQFLHLVNRNIGFPDILQTFIEQYRDAVLERG